MQSQAPTTLTRIRRVFALVPSVDRRRLRQAVRALSWLVVALIFAGTKWATEHYLTATLTQGLLAGLASALFIGLVLHLFHHRVEQAVDRLANRRTLARCAALRDLAKEVAFIKHRKTLAERVTTTVQRLLETEGAAIYLRHDDEMYRRVHATLPLPEFVKDDDSAVIQLVLRRVPMLVDNTGSALNGAFAWPLLSRGQLVGLLLCGNRTHAETFDDEELSAVSFLAEAVCATLLPIGTSDAARAHAAEQSGGHQVTAGVLAQPTALDGARIPELRGTGLRSTAHQANTAVSLRRPDAGLAAVHTRQTLAIVAHCDDLELGAGGTIARLIEEQWDVHVVVIESQAKLPSEERRRNVVDPASSAQDDSRQERARQREAEAVAGAGVLGVRSDRLLFLRASDSSESGAWNVRDIVSRIHDYCERVLGIRKPEFPFVITHTRHDRHLQHVQAHEIAGSAFKTPLLCFRVASSTLNTFDPAIGVDITRWIDVKQRAFEAHQSQSNLRFASGRLARDAIRSEASEWSSDVGFPFGEYFECDLTADLDINQLKPIVALSDSDHHFRKFITRLSGKPPDVVHAWSAILTQWRELSRRQLSTDRRSIRIDLHPNAAVADALRSARLPVAFSMTAIDGCAEILATPDEKSRYAGFARDQVECIGAEHFWSPTSDSSEPHHVRVAMMAALEEWRNQSNVPKVLRTLRAAPLEPVSDRRALRLLLGQSDYFTVRTLTQIVRKGSLAQLERLFPAREWWASTTATFSKDVPPYHVSVQGVILNHDTNTGQWALVMTAYAGHISPIAGGVSVGIAEQMLGHVHKHLNLAWWHEDEGEVAPLPTGEEDRHIFDTMERGLSEELGLQSGDYSSPLLLNASLEADMFFVTFLFLVRTELATQSIFQKWRTAPDRGEADVIALFPICTDADGGLSSEQAIDEVTRLLGQEFFNLEPYTLPAPLPPGRLGPRKWHHSSRMRLYVLARHLWGTAIESRVRLNVLN